MARRVEFLCATTGSVKEARHARLSLARPARSRTASSSGQELLRAIHTGDSEAIAALREHHPESIDPATAKLADAQLVLARSYQASSWTRLVHAVRLADAIWRDDLDEVRTLVSHNSALLHEDVLIRTDSNWGPPMTFAANLGRDGIIRLLHSLGAKDLQSAPDEPRSRAKPTRCA